MVPHMSIWDCKAVICSRQQSCYDMARGQPRKNNCSVDLDLPASNLPGHLRLLVFPFPILQLTDLLIFLPTPKRRPQSYLLVSRHA